jgi:hypothetical protein
MIVEISDNVMTQVTVPIIASITISNTIDINFVNIAIQAKIVDKLEDKDNDGKSINDDRMLIIKVIVHYLQLFTFRS